MKKSCANMAAQMCGKCLMIASIIYLSLLSSTVIDKWSRSHLLRAWRAFAGDPCDRPDQINQQAAGDTDWGAFWGFDVVRSWGYWWLVTEPSRCGLAFRRKGSQRLQSSQRNQSNSQSTSASPVRILIAFLKQEHRYNLVGSQLLLQMQEYGQRT